MARDFANRAGGRTKAAARPGAGQRSRAAAGRKPAQPRSRGQRPVFHGPSFSAGALLGAGLVLLGYYAPELLKASAERIEARQPDSATRAPEVNFEFDKLLRDSKVTATPEDYPAQFEDDQATANSKYLLQAASFRDSKDANTLRAQLLLLSLPAEIDQVQLDNGRWYRVNVGPFTNQVEAQRAMTRLRQHNLAAVMRKIPVDA